MHVLSTPPAFILSQDQTLMFNVDPSSRSTSFFILVITVLIKNVRWFLLKSSEKFIRIFKVVLLFSCQRSFCDPLLVCKKLYYFITVIFVCQELFWFILLFWTLSFCNNFYIISDLVCQELFNFSFRSDLYCSDRSPSATFIDYHIWSLMSRSFFILFRVKNGIWCYIFPPLFQRRWLSYHSCIQYVNYFFHLFKLI